MSGFACLRPMKESLPPGKLTVADQKRNSVWYVGKILTYEK
jgi:hypothetical protein